jgi:hypothetical protein
VVDLPRLEEVALLVHHEHLERLTEAERDEAGDGGGDADGAEIGGRGVGEEGLELGLLGEEAGRGVGARGGGTKAPRVRTRVLRVSGPAYLTNRRPNQLARHGRSAWAGERGAAASAAWMRGW